MTTYNATTGIETLNGSPGNSADTFVFTPGTAQAGDKVDGRGGVDTVQASGTAGDTVDLRPIGSNFTSVEVLKIDAGVTVTLDSGSTGGGAGRLPTNLTLDGDISGVAALNFSMNGGSLNLSSWQFGSNWTDGVDVLRVFGTGGADTITGSKRSDDLQGGSGADTIRGGAGDDKISGGADVDTVVISAPASTITSTASGWTVVSADGTDILTNVEIVNDGVHQTLLVGKGGFATIQAAVDAAENGDTILIANGSYAEQVVVSGKGDITIIGESEAGVVIRAPGALSQTGTDPQNSKAIFALVTASGSTNVTLKNLTIDGDSNAGAIVPGGDFVGVAYLNASGLIENVTVQEIRDTLVNATTVSGNQRGTNILSSNAAGSPNTLEIAHSTIKEFQKTGILARNTDVYIHDNEVHGFGPQAINAQNAIQLSQGSTGEVSDNLIDGIGFIPTTNTATGILAFGVSDGLIVSGNTITGTGINDAGLYLTGANGAQVSGNTFSGNSWGVIDSGHIITPNLVVNTGPTANTYTGISELGYLLEPNASDLPPFSVDGTEFNDWLQGASASDDLRGHDGDDNLLGQGGDDTLTGGDGADTIDGGAGVDTAVYADTLGVSSFTFTGGQWQVTGATSGTDDLANVEIVTDGAGNTFRLVGASGDDGYASIQAAINAADPGDFILIAPGEYTESHTTIHGTAGLYVNIAGLTLQGYSASTGEAITSGAAAKTDGPTIISGAQNGFGANHWIDVGGGNTSLQGLHLKAGNATNNKLLEIWGDAASVTNSFIDVYTPADIYTYAVGIYINDNGDPMTDEVNGFSIDGNILNEGIYIANGVGGTGGDADPDQKITNNHFEGEFSSVTGEGRYDAVGSGGSVPGTPWLNEAVQPPTFSGNTFANNSTPFILRGSDADLGNLPSAAQIQAYLAANGDANLTYAYGLTGGALATAPRDDGAGPYHSYAVTNSLDTLNLALDGTGDAVFGSTARDYIASGDTVVIQSAAGPVNSQVMVDDLTILATVNSADLNLTLAETFADGTDIAIDVQTVTLADYAPGLGADVDVTGNSAANTITGNSGENALGGAAGDDHLTGGAGDDALDGGADVDTAHYAGPVTLTATGSGWTVNATATGEGTDTLVNVEKIDTGATTTTLLVGSGGFGTIQAAIDAASAGDTILIAAGVYNENVNVNKAGLSLVGQGVVTIHGTFEADNGVTGEMHLWIEGQSAYSGAAGAGVRISSDNISLTNLNIDGFLHGINFSVDTAGTTLSQINITNSVIGIEKATTADINGLTINGGAITDSYMGIDFAKAVGVGNQNDGVASNVLIDGMSFTGISQKGIYVETLTFSTLRNIVMNDVGQFGGGAAFGAYGKNGNGINLNLKAGTYDNIVIEDFHLTDTGASDRRGLDAIGEAHGGAIVIAARDDGGVYGPQPAVVTDAIIIRNGTIDGHTSSGIQVGETTKTNADPDVVVSNVSISGAQHTGKHGELGNETLSTLTFTGTEGVDNIFTSAVSTGAILFKGGLGNDIFTGHGEFNTADFGTELSISAFTATGSTWTVNGGPEGTDTLTGVEKVSDASGGDFFLVGSGGYSTIQAAVNAASTGDTILLAAGTYTETVTITKGVNIIGAKHGIDGAASGRGVGDGAGEANIVGRFIVDTTQAVSVDGLRFVNNPAAGVNDYAAPSVEVKKGGDAAGHAIINTVFYSTVAGGAENDVAIFVRGAASGKTTISDNYVTGSTLGQYGTAAWGRGVYSDGGGQTLAIQGNTFQSVRTGLNLDSYNDAVTTVSQNTFVLAGTGIAIGIPTTGTYAGINNNLFQDVVADFNLQNLTVAADLDLANTGNASQAGQPTVVYGGSQGDTLGGTVGADLLEGRNGNDFLKGAGGDDVLNGGSGSDTAVYVQTITSAMLSFNGVNWTVTTGGAEGTDTLIGMEFVTDGVNTYSLAGGSPVSFTSTPALASVTEDLAVSAGSLISASTASFSDLDPGDTHTVTGTIDVDGSTAHADAVAATLVEGADYSLSNTVNEAARTVDYAWSVSNAAVQSLRAGESITLTAHRTISDGSSNASQDVVLTINGANDATTTSNVDLGSVQEDNGRVITEAELLANAIDVDGDDLTVSGVTVDHGAVVDNGNGTWTFTPDAHYSGPIGVSYAIEDGTGSIAATASLEIEAVSDTPTLVLSDATGPEDGSVSLSIASSLVDTDGSETLSITVSGVPTGATLSAGVDNGGGSWTLTAAQLAGLTLTPAPGYNGSFNIDVTATATDGAAAPADNSQSLLVTVIPGSGGIVTTADSLVVTRNLTSSLDLATLLGNDTGGTGGLTVTGVSNVVGGAASIVGGRLAINATAANGSFTYSVTDANNHVQTGVATFTSLVTDGNANAVSGGAAQGADLQGQGGNDIITGSVGLDRLVGGLGADTYYVTAGDVVVEDVDAGIDLVYSSTSHSLADNVEKMTLQGDANVDGTGNGLNNYMVGNNGSNVLTGGGGNDTLIGGAGIDTLIGGAGDDTYSVDNVDDLVTELLSEGVDQVNSTVSYSLTANVDKLVLTGTADINGTGNELDNYLLGNGGSNTLTGSGGRDTIVGGGGSDFLIGGLDGDQLTGGIGADTFIYQVISDFGSGGVNDRISDFSRVEGDKLDLILIDANSVTGGDQAFTFLGSGAFTSVAGQLRSTATASGNVVQGDTNGDGVADFSFVVVGPASLIASDFFL